MPTKSRHLVFAVPRSIDQEPRPGLGFGEIVSRESCDIESISILAFRLAIAWLGDMHATATGGPRGPQALTDAMARSGAGHVDLDSVKVPSWSRLRAGEFAVDSWRVEALERAAA